MDATFTVTLRGIPTLAFLKLANALWRTVEAVATVAGCAFTIRHSGPASLNSQLNRDDKPSDDGPSWR